MTCGLNLQKCRQTDQEDGSFIFFLSLHSRVVGILARPKTPAPRLPTQISIQTETTTGSEYRQPEMQKCWRYAETVPKKISDKIQSLTVYRASYKPNKIDAQTKPTKTCNICNTAAGRVEKVLRRNTMMPMDSLTTYMNHYKRQEPKCRKAIPSENQYCEFTTASVLKAHDYE